MYSFDDRIQALVDSANDPNEDHEIREGCALELLHLGLADLL